MLFIGVFFSLASHLFSVLICFCNMWTKWQLSKWFFLVLLLHWGEKTKKVIDNTHLIVSSLGCLFLSLLCCADIRLWALVTTIFRYGMFHSISIITGHVIARSPGVGREKCPVISSGLIEIFTCYSSTHQCDDIVDRCVLASVASRPVASHCRYCTSPCASLFHQLRFTVVLFHSSWHSVCLYCNAWHSFTSLYNNIEHDLVACFYWRHTRRAL